MSERSGQEHHPTRVSVIIPVHNAGHVLEEQLEALTLQQYSGDWEVVIADNLSADDSADRARRWAERLPALTITSADERPSASHARNAGASVARGDLLIFCDADDVAAPGWLGALVEAAQRADIVAGALDLDSLNEPLVRSWRFKGGGLAVGLGFMNYASTANCAVWRSVFEAVGGWSEDYVGAAGEDIDLSVRAQLAGHTLVYAPDAVMRYRYRSGLRNLARQSYTYGRANALLYRRFRGAGARRRTARQTLHVWAWLLLHLPDLWRSARGRGVWVRQAANIAGRLAGSLRYRVVFL